MLAHLRAFLLLTLTALPLAATAEGPPDRSATGGAQTLEDILARQRGEQIDDGFRRDAIGGGALPAPGLGPRGGASDPELWRALRYGEADISSQSRDPRATVLVQDGGMRWYALREGPLARAGAWLLGGTLAALLLFYLLRGRIEIAGQKTGRLVQRFGGFERFSHWLMAGSFLLLGLTGLLSLFGRKVIAPYFGLEANAMILSASKLIHNSVSWAFILSLIFTFLLWVRHNIPNRTDITWFAQAGGIIGSKHPPAKKFNGGQKIIFWSVILFGGLISLTGLSLLFPYELPIMAQLSGAANGIGLPGLFGAAPLSTELAPQEEMQLAHLAHALLAFLLMAIIIAHIYIGSVGMEGAYDAMGSGEVDEAWAEQHHALWLEEVRQKAAKPPAEPAE